MRLGNYKDLTGRRFGKLTAIEIVGVGYRGMAIWRCKCDCGGETTSMIRKLVDGKKKSCGCLWMTTGEYSGENRRNSRLSAILRQMKQRCRNPNNHGYSYYGAKGIDVCSQWDHEKDFEAWAYSNGYQNSLTIDRIDSTKGYEPSNCQWISNLENAAKNGSWRRKGAQRKSA